MMNITEENGNLLVMKNDAGDFIGQLQYIDRGKELLITHTGIDPDYRRQGLAAELVMAAIDKARRESKKIAATCPYAVTYFREHHDELADVLNK